MNLPNKLTLLRVLLIPVFMLFVEWDTLPGHFLLALAVFAAASLTDLLDGYIARKYDMVTDFGKFMDPLADKVLVMTALVYFSYLGAAPSWAVILILAREFLVTSLRLVAAGKGVVIAADRIGKYKTAFTMVWICYGLLVLHFLVPITESGAFYFVWGNYLLMAASVALTVLSGIHYIRANWDLVKQAK